MVNRNAGAAVGLGKLNCNGTVRVPGGSLDGVLNDVLHHHQQRVPARDHGDILRRGQRDLNLVLQIAVYPDKVVHHPVQHLPQVNGVHLRVVGCGGYIQDRVNALINAIGVLVKLLGELSYLR
jgi:hypothetical protein